MLSYKDFDPLQYLAATLGVVLFSVVLTETMNTVGYYLDINPWTAAALIHTLSSVFF